MASAFVGSIDSLKNPARPAARAASALAGRKVAGYGPPDFATGIALSEEFCKTALCRK